jgi:hypothetical protein
MWVFVENGAGGRPGGIGESELRMFPFNMIDARGDVRGEPIFSTFKVNLHS